MRKGVPAALLVCALAGAVFLYFLRDRPSAPVVNASSATQPDQAAPSSAHNPKSLTGASVPPAASPTAPAAAPVVTAAIASKSAPPPGVSGQLFFGGPESTPVQLPPETVLENTRTAIRNYGSMFGGNPVGTNPEITQSLNGENPREVKFLDPEKGMRINSNGELVDPWGTPFFFHQLSAQETEIRSAGPDRQLWTADDLVIK